ncbi:MAG TPA: transcriptional regulator [Oceanipulchritudo sp.]|nr:transcriptional regulator [Oceanipulchritudo sp.]
MPRKQLHSRPPLARMMRIHQQLKEGKFPNCSTLARKIEVSTKTIQRDIEYMRDQLGLPVEYDGPRHGYAYTEEVTSFPMIPATEGELLALFVAQKALSQYRGTPFERPLAHAFAKLAEVMESEITVHPDELAQALSFHHTGVAVTNLEIFQTVTKALTECRELEFNYKKLNGNRPEKRRVQPYHLASIDGQWYLFANDLGRQDIRTFVLGRIQDQPIVGKKFRKPDDFSLTDRLMGTFGVFKGEGSFHVRIEFDSYAAQLVRERHWHSSQELKDLPGGALELRMRVDALEEVERWILSWGGHAKVIAPSALKQRVKAALQDMQDAYAVAPRWLADLHEASQSYQPDRLLQLVLSMERSLDAPGQLMLGLKSKV